MNAARVVGFVCPNGTGKLRGRNGNTKAEHSHTAIKVNTKITKITKDTLKIKQ